VELELDASFAGHIYTLLDVRPVKLSTRFITAILSFYSAVVGTQFFAGFHRSVMTAGD